MTPCPVEVLGRYSNLCDQGERLSDLLQIAPTGPTKAKTRTIRQVQRRLRPDEVAQLLIGYQEGLTVFQLAERFRIHRGTVTSILKRNGVTMRNRSLTADQIEHAVAMYREGLSLVKVADRIGCSHGTIWNALTTAGVALRKRPGWKY
jgi:DNA-directed RNA polymerase specialized sigma24 family protein